MVFNLMNFLRMTMVIFFLIFTAETLKAVEMPVNNGDKKLTAALNDIPSVTRLERSILVKVNARKLKTLYKKHANFKSRDAIGQELSKILKE